MAAQVLAIIRKHDNSSMVETRRQFCIGYYLIDDGFWFLCKDHSVLLIDRENSTVGRIHDDDWVAFLEAFIGEVSDYTAEVIKAREAVTSTKKLLDELTNLLDTTTTTTTTTHH
jgi:hypothetical protein